MVSAVTSSVLFEGRRHGGGRSAPCACWMQGVVFISLLFLLWAPLIHTCLFFIPRDSVVVAPSHPALLASVLPDFKRLTLPVLIQSFAFKYCLYSDYSQMFISSPNFPSWIPQQNIQLGCLKSHLNLTCTKSWFSVPNVVRFWTQEIRRSSIRLPQL